MIREAAEDDVAELVRLQRQVASTSIDTALPILRKMARYPFYKAFLACIDGRPVGTFSLLVMDNMGHDGAPVAIVENVAVDLPLRGAGIGRAMMDGAQAIARAQGCYKLILSSNVKRTEAHHFYESLGFARQGYAFSLDL